MSRLEEAPAAEGRDVPVPDDIVDAASAASFPASDAPGWAIGRAWKSAQTPRSSREVLRQARSRARRRHAAAGDAPAAEE